jgi:hypothetical protein
VERAHEFADLLSGLGIRRWHALQAADDPIPIGRTRIGRHVWPTATAAIFAAISSRLGATSNAVNSAATAWVISWAIYALGDSPVSSSNRSQLGDIPCFFRT